MNDRVWIKLIQETMNTDIESAVGEIVGFSNYAENYDEAEQFLLSLCDNADPNIRGISILGLGHLARVHRQSSNEAVSVVQKALKDTDSYVSGHADSAADDIAQFTKFMVKKHDL